MTFLEVLFSVIILGVGLIMIAAVFPVAIQQTQGNVDETVASTAARGGIDTLSRATISALFASGTLPTTGGAGTAAKMKSFRDGDASLVLWKAVRGNLILPEDPRYAWVPFYKWSQGDPYAQVVVIAVRERNKSAYDPNIDLERYPSDTAASTTPAATLEGQSITFTTTYNSGKQAWYLNSSSANAQAIAPLTYIVVSDDPSNTGSQNHNGYIFRIGNLDNSGLGWQLMSGNDPPATDNPMTNAVGYVVGKGYKDPTNPSAGFDGPTQDVAAYTTFINVN